MNETSIIFTTITTILQGVLKLVGWHHAGVSKIFYFSGRLQKLDSLYRTAEKCQK